MTQSESFLLFFQSSDQTLYSPKTLRALRGARYNHAPLDYPIVYHSVLLLLQE